MAILSTLRCSNRNLKISKALLKSQAHQGTSLFTSAATNQRGFSKGGQKELRSDFQNTRSKYDDRLFLAIMITNWWFMKFYSPWASPPLVKTAMVLPTNEFLAICFPSFPGVIQMLCLRSSPPSGLDAAIFVP